MKFNLPRPVMDDEKLNQVALREIRRQKIEVSRATQKNLRELAEVCKAIEESGLPDNLICKKLPDGLGMGVFLHPKAKPMLKGQIIASYSGVVSLISQNLPDDSAYAFAPIVDIPLTKEEQAYFTPKSRYHPKRLHALDVDAVKKGNFTRFINHSDKPNVVAHLFKIPPNEFSLAPSPIEVIYTVKKTIHPGEQLLVCYEGDGDSYWNFLKIKPISITPKTFFLNASLKVEKRKQS